MIYSKRNVLLVVLTGVLGLAGAIALLACTDTPPPVSPIPTPASPIELPAKPAVVAGETFIYWGDPSIPITGHAAFRCPDDHPQCAEQWQLRIDLELWQDGAILMTQTVETGRNAVSEVSHGLFGTESWEWPDFDGEAEERARLVWYSSVYTPTFVGWHVDENNQVSERDERGFSSIGTIQGAYSIYMPLIFFRPK